MPSRLKQSNRKLWIMVLVLIALGALTGFFFSSQKKDTKTKTTANSPTATPSPIPTIVVPAGWNVTKENAEPIIFKAEKNAVNEFRPTVVVLKSAVKDELPKEYVGKLVKGAKLSLPSLKFTVDKETKKGNYYIRDLQGSYSQGNTRVYLRQQIAVQDALVYTTTASYTDRSLEKEIGEIFDAIDQTLLTK